MTRDLRRAINLRVDTRSRTLPRFDVDPRRSRRPQSKIVERVKFRRAVTDGCA